MQPAPDFESARWEAIVSALHDASASAQAPDALPDDATVALVRRLLGATPEAVGRGAPRHYGREAVHYLREAGEWMLADALQYGWRQGGPARGKPGYHHWYGTPPDSGKRTQKTEPHTGSPRRKVDDVVSSLRADIESGGIKDETLAALKDLTSDQLSTLRHYLGLGKRQGKGEKKGAFRERLEGKLRAPEKSAPSPLDNAGEEGKIPPDSHQTATSGGSEMNLESLLAGDLSDTNHRKVTADALEEAGREGEAALLRAAGEDVVATSMGRVVRREYAEQAKVHGREARPDKAPREYTRKEGTRRVGEVFRDKTHGMMLVVESSDPVYISQDRIDDNDDWALYPQPGRYGHYRAIAVEESASDRSEREAKEAKEAKEKSEAEAKRKAEADAWAPAADLPIAYSLPGGLKHSDLAWTVVSDDRGIVRSVATLPAGETVGHVSSSSYDDHRSWYHLPASAADAAHWGSAEKSGLGAQWAREFLEKYGPDVAGGDQAQAILRAPADVAARLEAAEGRRKDFEADRARAQELYSQLSNLAYDDPEYDRIEEERAALAEKHEGSPFGTINRLRSKRAVARMYEPTPGREEAAKARAADPLVTVTGNTYPHKDDIKRIPGAKWDAAARAWRIPKSQVGRLPRKLSYEE